MPILKKWDTTYNFTAKWKNSRGDMFKYFIYLDQGFMTRVAMNADGTALDNTKTNNMPIRIDKDHGLMMWDAALEIYTPLVDEFQKALCDYVAEVSLLGGKDADI